MRFIRHERGSVLTPVEGLKKYLNMEYTLSN